MTQRRRAAAPRKAFTLRSRRLVAHEAITEYLAELALPDAKIERLDKAAEPKK